MDKLFEVFKNHKSCRKFKNTIINEEIKNKLIESAQMAPSSCFFQSFSIIEVSSIEGREILYNCSGRQEYIKEAPLVYLFIADLAKIKKLTQDGNEDKINSAEMLLVSTTDAAFASQNMLNMAESMGLGTVYIGGIRRDTKKIIEYFNLPRNTFPLYLLLIGEKDESGFIKPRMDKNLIVHKEKYSMIGFEQLINEYNSKTKEYYSKRGEKDMNWVIATRNYVDIMQRDILSILRQQGFDI